MHAEGQTGLYVHWPFCMRKCPYCDFNVHVREEINHQSWRDAYLRAIDYYADRLPDRIIGSVFFGGGTPSLMAPETVEAVLDKIRRRWRIANDMEVTLEANPTSVEREKFAAFKEAGINRVSLGVQALNDKDLHFLGRTHNVREAEEALAVTAQIFPRYSFDLIYARPGQDLAAWEVELQRAVPLARGHISLYQLTIERSTPFYLRHRRGEFSMPGENLAADFYDLTQGVLEAENMPAYEVSNHAAAGQESRHNLVYWHYGEYIGIGPGAHGRVSMGGRHYATREHQAPEIWLERALETGSTAHPYEELAPADRFEEALMTGLRLRAGIDLEQTAKRLGTDWSAHIRPERVTRCAGEGWAVFDGRVLALTREGTIRLNGVVPYLLGV